MSDLANHIDATALMDTHEHLYDEPSYLADPPDVLVNLFGMYIGDDLLVAGAPYDNVVRLLDARDPDIAGRWRGVEAAWDRCRFTGYGRMVRLLARTIYGLEELTLDGILAAGAINDQLIRPGARLRLLKETANLDHVQVDDFTWPCLPDPSGPDFFLNDISWAHLASGQVDAAGLHAETGLTVVDLASLKQALAGLVDRYGPCAIAIKAQHAYERTLTWVERDDAEVEPVLQKHLRGQDLTEAESLCLGDWCLARGAELAAAHNLPLKIHTGYLAGTGNTIQHRRIAAANLVPLIQRHPDTRFVLMHISYPYSDELVAMAKHYINVYVDLCWAWSINPYHAADFVRRMLHAVPTNKLFAFGGDTHWPAGVVAFAMQARAGLTRALQGEIDDGFMTEAEAIDVATRLMRGNQSACFDLDGTRAAIRAQLDTAALGET